MRAILESCTLHLGKSFSTGLRLNPSIKEKKNRDHGVLKCRLYWEGNWESPVWLYQNRQVMSILDSYGEIVCNFIDFHSYVAKW